jgi:O-antigen/teichoic acid export membrane protein
MNRKPTMITKTSWLIFGRIVSHALSLLFYIYLARTFGESGIGNYSYAFGIVALFVIGVQLGIQQLTTRDIAQDPDKAKDYFGNFSML